MLTWEKRFWLFSLSLLAFTIVSKVFFLHGSVYSLDYGLFHPDGMLYSFKTLLYLGYSEFNAGSEVSRFYLHHAVGNPIIAPESLYLAHNSSWAIFQFRILYPLLSTPFVYIFGLWGMLVVPIFSFILLWFFVSVKLKERMVLAVVTLAILSSSTTISRWMFSDISDSLLVALMTLYVWVHPRLEQETRIKNLIITSVFILATGLTRFSLLLWLGIGLFYALKRNFFMSAGIAVTASITFLPTLFVSFAGAILPSYADAPWYEKLGLFPIQLVRMHFVDLGQLFVLDRIFFGGLCLVFWLALRNFRNKSTWLLLIVFCSLVLTAGINGVLGVNFRYHMPILPFVISFLGDYVDDCLRLKK